MDLCRESVVESLLRHGYNPHVEELRPVEYPQLTECTYLDHGGTTLYAKSAIEAFSADLCSNLYGNPHSLSPSSQLSTKREESVRLRVLQFFNADPDHFDVVFCANATAAMKIVAEAFSAHPSGFSYKYHGDAHTSLIGIRELSNGAQCLFADTNVENWLEAPPQGEGPGLFGWPAQSNFSGRRLPLNWSGKLRNSRWNYYSLLDAASFLTTSPLDLSDASAAPDFTVLSFYKIFGFPDLGALIVRRDSCDILRKRRYFGGGTVDSLVATKTDFVARKNDSPHSYLEDGTIAFHSIIALDTAMSAYERLYGNPLNTSRHAFALGTLMYELLSGLKHGNGRKVCTTYGGGDFSSRSTQGPVIAFNLQKADGSWIGYAEVEKLASVKNIHIRVGGMCNPGGIEGYVGLRTWEIEQNYAAGHKCSDDNDIMNGKPTGAIRVSLGAMSTADDVLSLVRFVDEFYVEKDARTDMRLETTVDSRSECQVQSLIIYPIKSCGGFRIPAGLPWEVRPHGLAWDREWCLVHLGTHRALSQKVNPKLTILRPSIDLNAGILTISVHNSPSITPLHIPLGESPSDLTDLRSSGSRVCGDEITALTYESPEVVEFFTTVLGVSCTLARFPAESTNRNYKPYLPNVTPNNDSKRPKILLSNESPILIVNQSSVDKLNSEIERTGGKAASADVFRANIVLKDMGATKHPYAEDGWSYVKIGQEYFELLKPCRRCHMVCIDQETAEKNEEPFVTLTKTRRFGGGVLFGQHAMHLPLQSRGEKATIKVGDRVKVWEMEEQELTEEISVLAEKLLAVTSSKSPVVEVQLERRWLFNSF